MTIASNKAKTFYPPRRVLMGPGPSDVPPRVLEAIARPTLGPDPVFADMMEELRGLLRYAFQTNNAVTFPVSGPGSVGMETCFVKLVNHGDKVIVCRNGMFGGRMIENEMLSKAHAVPFQPYGKPKMKEWIQINRTRSADYEQGADLFRVSIKFVSQLPNAKGKKK